MSIPEINLLHVNRDNIDQQIYFHASILEKLVELRKNMMMKMMKWKMMNVKI